MLYQIVIEIHYINETCHLLCRCEANHWGIARGVGCDPCDCDPVGSLSETCNEFDGVCQCKDGFGGRQCNECQANYWGDPNVECFPCECDPMNSQSLQCDYETGKCTCYEGITTSITISFYFLLPTI